MPISLYASHIFPQKPYLNTLILLFISYYTNKYGLLYEYINIFLYTISNTSYDFLHSFRYEFNKDVNLSYLLTFFIQRDPLI